MSDATTDHKIEWRNAPANPSLGCKLVTAEDLKRPYPEVIREAQRRKADKGKGEPKEGTH